MNRFVLSLTLALVLAMGVLCLPAFSQDTKAEPAQGPEPVAAPAAAPAVAEESSQAKELSVYGEVQSVNAEANTISVQYYDYDSDQEKTADIVADKDTKIENVSGIDKIDKGDWIDIIYVVRDAKNVAKSMIVEKEEPEAPVAEKVAAEAPVE